MDYVFTLEHLFRSPLRLNRVPGYLCVQIILKQSVHSIFNLPFTNSRCVGLVEAALSSNPNVAIIQEILPKIDKTTAMSAIRLAKTRSTVTAAFDGYVESVVSIRPPLLANGGELNKLISKFRFMEYRQYSLLLSSFQAHLWPAAVDPSVNREIIMKHKSASSKKGQMEENGWKYELLGYTFIPDKMTRL